MIEGGADDREEPMLLLLLLLLQQQITFWIGGVETMKLGNRVSASCLKWSF